MGRYRKKPVEIKAVQWTGDNEADLVAFAGTNFRTVHPDDRGDDPDQTAEAYDYLHSTWVGMHTGDWVIRGIKGEHYPCEPDVFVATYDAVEEPPPAQADTELPGMWEAADLIGGQTDAEPAQRED